MNKSYLIIGAADSSHVKKWAAGMKDRGYKVSIFSFYAPVDNWYDNHQIEVISYFNNHSKKGLKKFFYVFAAFKLRKVLKNNYTIVNAHYASSYGFVSILAGAKNLLTSYWGTDIFVFPKKNFLTKMITKYVLKNSAYILSSSQIMAEEINKYTNRKVEIIPFGIDLELFTPSPHTTAKDIGKTIKIGIVKSLLPIYRIDVAIEAIKKIKGFNIELYICGDGFLLKELKSIATDAVKFVGRIDNGKVSNFIKSMDIMLNPTEFESFGVSIIESMACGIPVIAHDAGGASEIIKHKNTGILYSPNNAETLRLEIESLLKDHSQYSKIAINGRLKVEEHFDFQKNLTTFIKLADTNINNL